MPSDAQRISRRQILQDLGAVALAGAVAAAPNELQAATLKVGRPAPPASLRLLDGEQVSTGQYLGQVVILTFWATWCVPCREELPLLSDYAQAHAAAGLAVLGFSLDTPDNLAQVRDVARRLSFPNGLLGGDRLAGYGRIWRIPVNFTIDRQGVLADNGWDDKQPVWTAQRLERIVGPLLRVPRGSPSS